MSAYKKVKDNILKSSKNSNRSKDEICLIAVSKTKPQSEILELFRLGQIVFGENKLQEIEQKSPALSDEIEWHFIGRIQRNKIRKILQYSNWLHSVDSLKLLDAINRIAKEERKLPNIFLQINIDNEASKGGFLSNEIDDIIRHALTLEHVKVVGLMCIPAPQSNSELVRPAFKKISSVKDTLEKTHSLSLPYLSMGMSSDYQVAIEEGSTHIRVGSALFGARSTT